MARGGYFDDNNRVSMFAVSNGDGSTPVPLWADPTTHALVVSPVTFAAPQHVIVDSGSITANAGTNLNTSLLALESGGNLAAAKTDLDTLAGTVSASKVNINISSGNITNFALETGGNLTTLAGAVSASKMNVNISSGNITGFALETGGNLATIAGAVSASKMNVNISSGSIANTSFEATQATAASLNATVVGTGTFATQLTAVPLVSGPLVGQSKIAVTGTAVRLNGGTSQVLTNGLIISAPSGNADPIVIGGSGVTNTTDGTGNGYVLAPGASVSFAINNTNVLYINGFANDYVSWAGS